MDCLVYEKASWKGLAASLEILAGSNNKSVLMPTAPEPGPEPTGGMCATWTSAQNKRSAGPDDQEPMIWCPCASNAWACHPVYMKRIGF